MTKNVKCSPRPEKAEGLGEIIDNRVRFPGGTAAVNAEGSTLRKQVIGES